MTPQDKVELTRLAVAALVWVVLFAAAWALCLRDVHRSDRATDDEERRAMRHG